MFKTRVNRRDFLAGTAAAMGVALAGSSLKSAMAAETDAKTSETAAAAPEAAGPFKLSPLPYAYDALEPHIDVQTMHIHHDKHHAAYVANLNKAVAGQAVLNGKSAEELLKNLSEVPEAVRTAIQNNAGGDVNHTMFWEIMTPGGAKQPTGSLADAINGAFGNVDNFKKAFEEAGAKRFGSGWAWLVQPKGAKKLEIISTANQDSPLLQGHSPILGNDVWEHAYYLKYQNKRGDYLKAWWNVLNWDKVAERFSKLS